MFEVVTPKTAQNKMYNALKYAAFWKAGNSSNKRKYQKRIPGFREAF